MFDQVDLTDTLRGLPWFVDLRIDQIEKVARISHLVQLGINDELFHECGKQDFLFILLDGEVKLEMLVPTHGELHIYDAQPLDIIGWDQLTPVIRQRFGSTYAAQPSLLIAIDGDALRALCEEDHEIGYVVYRRIANLVASRMLNIRLVLSDVMIKHP